MSGGARAVIVVHVSRELVRTMGEDAVRRWVIDRHDGDWPVRGPRGGRYLAKASQATVWTLDKEEFFGPEWRFLGHRRDLTYVRPGSRMATLFAESAA